MKISKASEADLDMAIDLAAALDVLTHRWCATMPQAVQKLEGDEDSEPFDRDDDEQCGRALRHLLDTVNRGCLFRVVWGMSVVLDPLNRCVDPQADTIEHHPDAMAGLVFTADRAGEIAADMNAIRAAIAPKEPANES